MILFILIFSESEAMQDNPLTIEKNKLNQRENVGELFKIKHILGKILLLFCGLITVRMYQSSSEKQNVKLPFVKKQYIEICEEKSLIKFMSGNSSRYRYRFIKECKIDINNCQVDEQIFKRIYLMSHKWRSLNQIVIKKPGYMKFHKNYI